MPLKWFIRYSGEKRRLCNEACDILTCKNSGLTRHFMLSVQKESVKRLKNGKKYHLLILCMAYSATFHDQVIPAQK
jgi:hypothetical protein